MGTSPGYILVGNFINPISPKKAVLCDGAIAIGLRTQTIREAGYLANVRKKYPTWQIVSVDEAVILPAFADAHADFFTFNLKKKRKAKRIDWIKKYFVQENSKFSDLTYVSQAAYEFFADFQKNGTLTAFLNLSLNFNEIAVLSKLPEPYCRVRFYAGPIIINHQLPPELNQSKSELLDMIREISNWYRKYFVITPGSAAFCDSNLLYSISSFALEGVFAQSRLGIYPDELNDAKKIHEGIECLTDAFDTAGLLSSRTIFTGCNHLLEKDWRALSAMNSLVAHTPLADEALRTDRMKLEKLREYQVNWALASDVGASPTISMLAVMQSFLRVHHKYSNVSAVEALYRGTRALPEFIGLKNHGVIEAGAPANFVILKSPEATRTLDPEKALRILMDGTISELEGRVLATISKGNVVYGEIPNYIQ